MLQCKWMYAECIHVHTKTLSHSDAKCTRTSQLAAFVVEEGKCWRVRSRWNRTKRGNVIKHTYCLWLSVSCSNMNQPLQQIYHVSSSGHYCSRFSSHAPLSPDLQSIFHQKTLSCCCSRTHFHSAVKKIFNIWGTWHLHFINSTFQPHCEPSLSSLLLFISFFFNEGGFILRLALPLASTFQSKMNKQKTEV